MFLDERRPTVNELSNQKGVAQKATGWKLFHMAAQIEDLVSQGCGNTMPDSSDLVQFHSGQVKNFYLFVLGQVQMH